MEARSRFPLSAKETKDPGGNSVEKRQDVRWVGLIPSVPRHKGVRRFFRAFPPILSAASGWFSRVFRTAGKGGRRRRRSGRKLVENWRFLSLFVCRLAGAWVALWSRGLHSRVPPLVTSTVTGSDRIYGSRRNQQT